MSEVYAAEQDMKGKRMEFRKELLDSTYKVKSYINAIHEDMKSLKMRPGAASQIKASIDNKRQEIH
jgi:hypothetical protein